MKKRIVSTLFSIFIWGSGQFFIGKQKIKGLLFFLVQLLFFAIELGTGYWFNYFAGQIEDFDLRLYGGFFSKGLWGFVTMGTKEGIRGDHSTILMINGILVSMVLLFFISVYIWNVLDAYKVGKALDTKGSVNVQSFATIKKKFFPYLVLTPVIIIITLFILLPIIFSVLTAFTNYDANHLPPAHLIDWVGLDNFKKVLNIPVWTKTFLNVLVWTVVWAICATFSTYALGLLQALMLNNKHVKLKGVFRTIYILPWAIPGMISLMVFRNMLNGQFGPLNQFLIELGLISERIPFLTHSLIAKVTVIVVNLWLGFPNFMIMILGVLANQDSDLYEAASIDGANKFQVFSKIKLPLLLTATAPLIVMNFAGNFNAFGSIYFLTDGGPVNPNYQFAGDTDILISWIYKLTLDQKMYSMAAVMNILIFIFIALVSVWNFRRTDAFKEI